MIGTKQLTMLSGRDENIRNELRISQSSTKPTPNTSQAMSVTRMKMNKRRERNTKTYETKNTYETAI